MRRKPFQLVESGLSHDTLECLEQLMSGAKSGDVIGLAYAVMYKGRNFDVDVAGEAHRNPTFALGMVRVLDYALSMKTVSGK